jgi:predicted regulator of Ras-like GTPase activity (Roadblock/LC7/MglB family)
VTGTEALADLMEISSQVEAAVVVDAEGSPVASTLEDESRAAGLAGAGMELLRAAEDLRPSGGAAVTQLDAATRSGGVFVVREEGRTIVATTSPSPTVGLVFYDLKTCLRAFAPGQGTQDAPAGTESPDTARDGDGDAAA